MVVMVVEVLYSRDNDEVMCDIHVIHPILVIHSSHSLTRSLTYYQSINQSIFILMYRIVKSIIYIHVHNVYIF